MPYIASSRTSTGGQHRREPGGGRAVERPAVEREREERRVADQVAEARARRLARRAPCRTGRARDARAPRATARRRTLDVPLGVLLLGVRDRFVRRVRNLLQELVPGGLGCGELLLERRSCSLTCFSSSTCSGVGLPWIFCRPRKSSTCGISSRQRASASSSRSNASPAPLRATAARKRSGSARAALRSITLSGGTRRDR